MSICRVCKEEKIETDFPFRDKKINIRRYECKSCTSKYNAKYRDENKDSIIQRRKNFYKTNRNHILTKVKSYSQNNRKIIRVTKNAYVKKRVKNDPIFALRQKVSQLVRIALRRFGGNKGGNSILDFLPYSIRELKEHLEKQFEPWMNWTNQGVYKISEWNDNDPTTWKWQLDHIIPQSKLPYTSMKDNNYEKCWALKNLRPYSAKLNVIDNKR